MNKQGEHPIILAAVSELIRRTLSGINDARLDEKKRLQVVAELGAAAKILICRGEADQVVTRDMLLLYAIEHAEKAAEIMSYATEGKTND